MVLRNTLDRKKKRQLEDMILQHKDEIEAGKWSQTALAEWASRRLECPVTAANVKGAATTVEITFPTSPRGTGLKDTRQVKAAIYVLAKEMERILTLMGEVPTIEVQMLLKDDPRNGG